MRCELLGQFPDGQEIPFEVIAQVQKDEDACEDAGVVEVHVLEGGRVGGYDPAHPVGLDAEERRLNGDHERIQGGVDVDAVFNENVNACRERGIQEGREKFRLKKFDR